MHEALFSPSWYRVSELKPRLRGHTQIYRHEYRGELWYVMQDHARGRYYRFSPAGYQLIGRMDGKRSVQQLWEHAIDTEAGKELTQDEVIRLLSQLHAADVLICDVSPDTAELLRRYERVEELRRKQQLKNPLAIRIPLLDPNRFLDRTIPFVRPLFTRAGFLVWLAVMAFAIVMAGAHWPDLTRNVADRVMAADSLLTLALVYPLVKTLHELGHGYAVKAWGGEVHEMGVMLLVLMPVPYVDASAASEFRSKHRRVVVGAAGILVELLLGALALFLWINLEPGRLRSVMFSIMVIGSVSTVLFNGNPLLRYDGYYILADLLDMPNLSQRSQQYLNYVIKRYGFWMRDAQRPHTAPGERAWLLVYAIASLIYRLFVYALIILFVAGKFFFIGVMLAFWAAFNRLVMPFWKGAQYIVTHPSLRNRRVRAGVISLVALGAIAALLFAVPLPLRTRTEGVVWIPEESMVRAGANGFVREVVAQPGSQVGVGDLLIRCDEPNLKADVVVLRSRIEEARSLYDAALTVDRVQAEIIKAEIVDLQAKLTRGEEMLSELEIRSPVEGLFVLPQAPDLPDRYFQKGQLVAFVLDVDDPTIRVVVPQSSVDLVRQRTEGIHVRLAEGLDQTLEARMEREVPEGEARLPSSTLGMLGGGRFAIDPTEAGGTKTFENLFQFDLRLNESPRAVHVGGRVHVRFHHGAEPAGVQVYRQVRQLFLRRFSV